MAETHIAQVNFVVYDWHAAWNNRAKIRPAPRSLSMSSPLRVAIAVTLTAAGLTAAAATAAAQGGPPGTCACAAPIAPGVAAADLPRWGVGLRMTSLTLAPEGTPDAETEYGGAGLQVRYRVAPRWQLELSFDHLREHRADGTDGDRQLKSGTLAALYHLQPHARWDWYVLAGVGATGDGRPDRSADQRHASQASHGHLGAGVERRFRRFGIAAELRAVGIAPPDAGHGDKAAPTPTDPSTTIPTQEIERQGQSGGQLSVAATYYF